jgi:hypothetical protein
VESTLIGPWSIFTVLWFGGAVYAFAPSQIEAILKALDRRQPRWRTPIAFPSGRLPAG